MVLPLSPMFNQVSTPSFFTNETITWCSFQQKSETGHVRNKYVTCYQLRECWIYPVLQG